MVRDKNIQTYFSSSVPTLGHFTCWIMMVSLSSLQFQVSHNTNYDPLPATKTYNPQRCAANYTVSQKNVTTFSVIS